MDNKLKIINKESNENNKINKNNSHLNNNTSISNSKHLNLPAINGNKRIYIHKPTDFIKNKYTFLGNLANNSELLSFENKKTYHYPKFSMQDIKRKIIIENQIIVSIIKDEVNSLPILLRNLIPSLNKIKENQNGNLKKNKNANEYENYFFGNNVNYNNYQSNNNSNSRNSSLKRSQNENSNRNDIKAYGLNAGQIAKRADRLVNLNFLISNAKKRREPNISDFQDKINYN